jgi:hypothetical protein
VVKTIQSLVKKIQPGKNYPKSGKINPKNLKCGKKWIFSLLENWIFL